MPAYDASALELAVEFVVGTYQGLLLDESHPMSTGEWFTVCSINDHILADAKRAKMLDRLDLKAKGIRR